MSEEATEPKKKKSMLPIIAAIVLVVAGGGFFMLKSKGGKPVKVAKVELAEKDTDLDEFLTNTSTPTIYVRAKLSVRLRKDYEETKFKDNTDDVRDAVISVFNSTSPDDVSNAAKRSKLKHTLAEAMNTALEGPLDDSADDTPAPARRGKKSERAIDDVPSKKAGPGPVDDWDSETGPVMKVRFSALATQ